MKTIYTIFPWLPGAPQPTHLTYAERLLDEARIKLLEQEQERERANANCQQLKARVERLERYLKGTNTQ